MEINITELTDDEINSRMSDLYKKLSIIGNLPTYNQFMVDQIYQLIDSYQDERERRNKLDIDSGCVLDTDKVPEKKMIEKKTEKKVVKMPTTFNKVYKKKKEEE